MFKAYSLKEFIRVPLKNEDFLIHRLENLHFLPSPSVKSPHSHLFYEVYILEQGYTIHNVDFSTYHLKDNSLFFINQEQIHHWEKNISQQLNGYRLLFTPQLIQTGFIPANLMWELMYWHGMKDHPLIKLTTESQIYTYAKLLHTEYLDPQGNEDNIKALLFLFLNEIKKLCTIRDITKGAPSDHILHYKRFLREVESNYDKDLSLKEYADMINISTRHLSRMVKLISNTTLSNLIIQRRILQSKRLLKYSELSISEIAHVIGFADSSYFCKVFKKLNGTTPLKFKKTLYEP